MKIASLRVVTRRYVSRAFERVGKRHSFIERESDELLGIMEIKFERGASKSSGSKGADAKAMRSISNLSPTE